MNSSIAKSSLITIVILGIVVIAVGLYWAKPQWTSYSQANTMLQEEEAKNVRLEETLNSITSFLEAYDKQEPNISTVNLALPVKSLKEAEFVSSLGQLAQASGIVLSNLQMSASGTAEKIAPPNTIQTQKITFTATGSYAAFNDFVLRLESHLRLIDIHHVSVKQDESGQLDYLVDLTTYYQN